jgi:hypothetical protein
VAAGLTNYVDGATNGLASVTYVDAQDSAVATSLTNYVDSATNGLASVAYVDSQDTGVATAATNYTDAATNAIPTPTLQEVTDSGSTTTTDVTLAGVEASYLAVGSSVYGVAPAIAMGNNANALGIYATSLGESIENNARSSLVWGNVGFADVTARWSSAGGLGCSIGSGVDAGVALGYYATNTHDRAYVWSGQIDGFASKGTGTFSIDPVGGTSGFYIGSLSLAGILGDYLPLAGGTMSGSIDMGDNDLFNAASVGISSLSPFLSISDDTPDAAFTTYGVDDTEIYVNAFSSTVIPYPFPSGRAITIYADEGYIEFGGDLDMASNRLVDVSSIIPDGTVPELASTGEIYYDPSTGALSWQSAISGVVNQVGFEDWRIAYNASGGDLVNGRAVYVTTNTVSVLVPATGDSITIPTIDYADATDINKRLASGFMTHTATNGGFCITTSRGLVRDVDTDAAFMPSQTIFMSTNGFICTSPPDDGYAIKLGNAAYTNALGQWTLYADIGQWMGDGISESAYNGMSVERQSVYLVEDGGSLYAQAEKIGGGDITYRFNGADYVLNCTSGSGTNGQARSSALTLGTDTVPVRNYVYVVPSTYPDAVLTNSTTHPNGSEFAWFCAVSLQSLVTSTNNGALFLQRFTDAVQHEGRGCISRERERIRQEGATWYGGMDTSVTIDTGTTPDTVDVAISSGITYQMHRQTTPAFDTSAGSKMYVINHPTTPYLEIDSLDDVLVDANGNSLTDTRYAMRLIVCAASGEDGVSRIFVNLPNGSYLTDNNAIDDVNNFDVRTVPEIIEGGAVNAARIVLRHRSVGGGTITLLANQDTRSERVNSGGGGAGSSTATEFPTSSFRVYDSTDSTKQIAFAATNITTATTVTIDVDDVGVKASSVSYDNSTSGLASDNVQGAIDEVVCGIPDTCWHDVQPLALYSATDTASRDTIAGGYRWVIMSSNVNRQAGIQWYFDSSGSVEIEATGYLSSTGVVTWASQTEVSGGTTVTGADQDTEYLTDGTGQMASVTNTIGTAGPHMIMLLRKASDAGDTAGDFFIERWRWRKLP